MNTLKERVTMESRRVMTVRAKTGAVAMAAREKEIGLGAITVAAGKAEARHQVQKGQLLQVQALLARFNSKSSHGALQRSLKSFPRFGFA
jgi:hypothetical protein